MHLHSINNIKISFVHMRLIKQQGHFVANIIVSFDQASISTPLLNNVHKHKWFDGFCNF